jgi:hypothetical protein
MYYSRQKNKYIAKRITILLLFLMFSILKLYSQSENNFQFERKNKSSYKINFVNFNNLIIVEIKLNGQPFNFLLDTGVDKTVVFGLEANSNVFMKNAEKILVRGVSGAKETYAYKTNNNKFQVGKLTDKNHTLYAIFDSDFNLSDKIGYPVQGIIGRDFFKDHTVKINYITNKIKVYNPKKRPKINKKYDSLNLRLFKNKPYIQTYLQQTDSLEKFTFLLDSGSGDAIWAKPYQNMKLPTKTFDDILGYGFAKIINGKKAKAKALKLGKYTLESPKIAYPDTISYKGIEFVKKSGSIGSEVMRRFHWIFDYSNQKVYFKSNSDFSEPFNYDMSGLILKYDGFQQIARFDNLFANSVAGVQTNNSEGYNKVKAPTYTIELRPLLVVDAVRPNSSAFYAGFVEGDIILKIKGKSSYRYNLEEIFDILSTREGEVIHFVIDRNGSIYDKSLTLKSRFSEEF